MNHSRSIRGQIVSDWKYEKNTFTLNLTVPANTTATVCLPAKDPQSVGESGGPPAWAAEIKVLRQEDGDVVLQASSGHYAFIGATR